MCGEPFYRPKGGGADVMFHAFNVVMNHALAETEELQEIGQKPVPVCNVAGEPFTGAGENEAAILFVFEQSFSPEALNHVGHAGLRDFQGGSDIDDPGVSLGIDQFQNAFEVIFDRGRGAGAARIPAGH